MKNNENFFRKIGRSFKEEFINGTTWFDWVFLAIGLVIQIVAIAIAVANNESGVYITAISGITGIISVVLFSRSKISAYIFGYIQLFTYLFGVAIPLCLWGEVIENIIYAITMVLGIIIWIKRYKKTSKDEICFEPKKLTVQTWSIIFTVSMLLIVGCAYLFPQLHKWFPTIFSGEDPEPWLDSITTVIPLVGQMLMVIGYKEQWTFWLVEDVISLIMFISLGNWIMIAQYIFWTANCIYGYFKWKKLENIEMKNIDEKNLQENNFEQNTEQTQIE